MTVRIAPSILSADFGRLGDEVQAAEAAGADWIHVDVMDGHFVPTITIGPLITEAVRKATTLTVDVHLMIEEPDRYVEAFVTAGADRVTVHQEACVHLHRTLGRIRELGALAGVALNPSTPLATISDVLQELDLVCIMSVNPGFGGQQFIPASTAKVGLAATLLAGVGRPVELQVDGGVDVRTAPELALAGATVLVAGSAVYRHPDGVEAAVRALKQCVDPR